MLQTADSKLLSNEKNIEQIEAHMLTLPQADCPVVHHFGPGIYIRELTLPAGTIAIGHKQRYEHLNVMLTGKVAIVDNGEIKILTAPMIFTGKPGRKIGYVIETCVWQNIYSTNETDVESLEKALLDKSEAWESASAATTDRREDNEDFFSLIKAAGFTPEEVREVSENESDQINYPDGYGSILTVRDSLIEGKGLFTSWPVAPETIIAPARIDGKRTPAGRYANHSKNPNSEFRIIGSDIYLVSKRHIGGCRGGDAGEEITVDYRQSLMISQKLNKGALCQG